MTGHERRLGRAAKWLGAGLAACVLAGAVAAEPASSGGNWAQWRGPNRDGISTDKNWTAQWPADGPAKLWSAKVGVGCASVVVANGKLYTVGNEDNTDTVWCLDAATGKELWKHSYPCKLDPKMFEGGPSSTPTVDGTAVYTLSRDGDLFCLAADSGKVLWTVNIVKDFGGRRPQWGYSGSPLVTGNLLIVDVGGPAASAVALDKKTGKLVWKAGGEKPGYSSPVLFEADGKKAVLIFNAFGLVAHDLASGTELWRHPWKTSYDVNAATPIVDGKRVFIASGYNKGGAMLEVAGGTPKSLWETKEMRNQFATSVLWQGHLYGFDESELKCLDAQTGEVKWKQAGLGKGTVLLADGKLIVLGEKGELVTAEASPDEFKPISRAQVLGKRCWVVPVLAGGRLYVKNNDGDLVCLDVSKK